MTSPKPTVRPTRADLIANRLAEQIVAGHYLPGEPIDEGQVATAFGVSRTPVREALRQLASSGLVEMRPHRASIVAQPDESTLREIFVVMAELEALCAAGAATSMTPLQRRELEKLHHTMRGLVHEVDALAYRDANAAFHAMIAGSCANGYLTDLTRATQRRLAPFRRAQFDSTPDRLARSYEEHSLVVTAILRADAAGAAEAMRRHIALSERAWEVLGAKRVAAA
ncbi:GntR family transcriptional regulator [uncultured Alsobacter sp.]|uniref:GntR family transcriptional regulator n=1 Tax=uncultured Alsobacter sp. TaxID=1748258 RepID=UPI0025F2F51A|nr:GntR family transcriptional regulator [uncultured Alsobacter sp.]